MGLVLGLGLEEMIESGLHYGERDRLVSFLGFFVFFFVLSMTYRCVLCVIGILWFMYSSFFGEVENVAAWV